MFCLRRLVVAGGLAVLTVWAGVMPCAAVEPAVKTVEPMKLEPAATIVDRAELAKQVKIYRDEWGRPHIDGTDDAAVAFGFAYAQAEDYFWQVEDVYILALGRYAEAHGPRGVNSDLLNRAFEITRRSQADFGRLEPKLQRIAAAFVAGLNHYLATHPDVKPRVITHFEPWHMLAMARHVTLEMTFRHSSLCETHLPRALPNIARALGSNAWALAPSRTASGHAMLMVNPHQPWFGFGQLYEAHLRSGEGWNFSGASFYGSPLPMMGHNEHLGWAFTVNEPDVADVWRVTFDDTTNPLNYRYGDGYRTATEWNDELQVRTVEGIETRTYTFRKTHHGPIVSVDQDNKQQRLAVRIAKLYDILLLRQIVELVRARNLTEFKAGMGLLNYPIMNAVYADTHGEIYYLYNGIVPRRDPQFDWTKPLDGADPRTEWQGYHTFAELPQITNPRSGYLQSCNSTPFTTTADDNPDPSRHPNYMVQDRDDDKRRAKMSRRLLGGMHKATFEQLEQAAFDTTVYWAIDELPRYAERFKKLQAEEPKLAERVKPYLDHLLAWDGRISAESTAATLCEAWYEELYGLDYPGEKMHEQYASDTNQQFRALSVAANELTQMHGDWRVPYGWVHRIQRHREVSELLWVPFTDHSPSLPSLGGHGPMGVIFTQYYTPSIYIPLVRTARKRYGVLGVTYLAVYEFGPKVRGSSVMQFGASGDRESPHYFDQAELVSQRRLKPEYFEWADVLSHARSAYHPGEKPLPPKPVAMP
ncbi:MAG: penicillin acylase family protein [Planctomycetaceae bacterium]|nr:penicillin acylase family protein [Planctomycetaceae bacterium]